MTITYLTGDATQPVKRPALIMHVCNDVGGWGRGFVLALSKRWPEPERVYREQQDRRLGATYFAQIPCENIMVANMVAQHDIRDCRHCGAPPIRYPALAECLRRVANHTEGGNLTIHAPRIGCGLAGGSWSVVDPLIDFYLRDREVYIYDLPGSKE